MLPVPFVIYIPRLELAMIRLEELSTQDHLLNQIQHGSPDPNSNRSHPLESLHLERPIPPRNIRHRDPWDMCLKCINVGRHRLLYSQQTSVSHRRSR